MDRSQPQIAGTRSVGTFGFQMIQKLCQKGAVQILKSQFGWRALQASLCKLEQQTKSVPIRADGVRAYFALRHQALGEEGFQQRGKVSSRIHWIPSQRCSRRRPAAAMSSGVELKYQ